MIEATTRLAAFYVLFFLIAIVWPTVRVWSMTGINPLVLPTGDSVAGFVGSWFKLLIALLGFYLVLGAAGLVAQIGPIKLPVQDALRLAGMVLLGISLVWVVVAQWQMGKSWRVGIDSANRTELVERGLFCVSRNPIFFGMMMQLIGLSLVLPDAITLTIAVTAFVLISVQIRQEEAHLLALHGGAYSSYCSKVRRWL